MLSLFRRSQVRTDETYQPTVSLIIAAYNEEGVIGEKIENSLKLDYPKDKLEIIVFSDASTDRTDEIVKSYANRGVKLLRIEGRKGKTYCQNEAAKIAQGEILIFSDADVICDPKVVKKLVSHFSDSKVGCVSGSFQYRGDTSIGGGRIYWNYEQKLKYLESKISSPVGVSGALYAIRRGVFEPIAPDLQEDFVRAIKTIQKGYKVIYEPKAINWSCITPDLTGEFRRRVRIVTQSAYSLLRDKSLLGLLNPFRYGLFSIQLWSHKILRWLSGLFLLLIFALNIPLVHQGLVYKITMAGQGAFYLLAFWGFLSETIFNRRPPRPAHVAYYFLLSCYAMLKGFYNGLRGRTIVAWKPRGM